MDNLALDCAIAFFSGIIYDAGCVGWVHYSEKGQAVATALFSMLCMSCQIAGIGESVKTLMAAPFLIIGHGLGSYLAVKLKAHLVTTG